MGPQIEILSINPADQQDDAEMIMMSLSSRYRVSEFRFPGA